MFVLNTDQRATLSLRQVKEGENSGFSNMKSGNSTRKEDTCKQFKYYGVEVSELDLDFEDEKCESQINLKMRTFTYGLDKNSSISLFLLIQLL